MGNASIQGRPSFLLGPRTVGLHQLLLAPRRHGVVVAELHRVAPLAAGEGLETGLVVGDLRQRHQRRQGGALARQRVVTVDAGALGGEVAGDVVPPVAGVWITDANVLALVSLMASRQMAAADLDLQAWHSDVVRAFAAAAWREYAALQHAVDSVAAITRLAPVMPALGEEVRARMQAQVDSLAAVRGAALKRAFAKRRVHKRYVALVHGALEGEGVIDAPLALAGGLVRVKMAVRPDGLASRTRWRARERHGELTLVDCWPETGRQHQIRAHLEHLGHPIVGDKLYPDERVFADYQDHGWEAVAGRLALARQALHAAELRFPHPTTGEEVVVESALPSDLRELLRRP